MALRKWKFSKRSNFRFFDGKLWWVFWKKMIFFQKIAERSKLVVKPDWKSKTSQNVRKFGVFFKKNGWVFPKWNIPIFQKIDKGIKFASKSDWNFESSRKVQIWIFLNETDGFFEKKRKFLKSAKVANLV